MTFEYCIEKVGLREGKLSKDPNDRGNYVSGKVGVGPVKGSKFGLSAMSYPDLDFDTLTWFEAKVIFYRDFWLKYKIGEMYPRIRLYLLDSVINHGSMGIKLLQIASKVRLVDGIVGPMTLAKSMQAHPLDFASVRSDYYLEISFNGTNDANDQKQLKGWMRRNLLVFNDTMEWWNENKTF